MNSKSFIREEFLSIQFLKFLVVGASGTIIDSSVLLLLKSLGWQTLPANVLAYSFGILNNYFWNSRWTFAQNEEKQNLEQFCQFTIISLVGLGLNSLIVLFLEPVLKGIPWIGQFGLITAKMTATAIVLIWNYLANHIWIFQNK